MTIIEMLSALRSRGIHLWVEGDKLKYRAPHGALTAELKSQLAERKSELLAVLKAGYPPLSENFSSIPVASRSGELPLSFAEEGLWLLEQLNPQSSAWNMQSRLRIDGPLAVPALQAALNRLVERQEILRTAFELRDEKPSRIIAPALSVELPVLSIPAFSAADEIRQLADDELKTPFELSNVPLFRARLLRLSAERHVLIVTKHHLITDAWSSKLFLQELLAFYQAIATGHPPGVPDLPVQYADYAHWLRRLKNEEIASHRSYWQNQLNGMRVIELPCDKQRPAGRSFRGATQRIRLPLDLSAALKALGKNEKATPFMVLLAAFKILLWRYTGVTDLVIGSTLAGRNRSGLEHLIGMFVNLLPLRSDLSGEPTFSETLRRVRDVCLDAYQHQDCPFEKLVQEVRPMRDPSRSSVFQILFNVTHLPPIPRQVHGLTLTEIAHADETARFDLTLFAPETQEGFEIIARYNRDLFALEGITELLEQYRHLLEQIVNDPNRKAGDYSLLTPSARKRLPDPTAVLDHSWEGAVHELFAAQAERRPEAWAVRDPRAAWTYKELNEHSNRLGHYLRAEHIGREDVVAIYGQRCAALVWALLGVLKAGAAFCVIDPAHPAARIRDYLIAADPKAFIVIGSSAEPDHESDEVLSRFSARCKITLPGASLSDAAPLLAHYPADNPATEISPDDLAYVVFTSGSTGKPKGVLGRHGPLTHFLPWLKETFELSENDRFSFLSGLATNKLQRELFTALCLGATICIPDPQDIGALGRLDAWLRQEAISVVHLTPAMAQLLEQSATEPIPSARRVFFGGDLLRLHDVDRARRLMPNAEIANFYNSSETQRGGGYFVFPRNIAGDMKHIPPLGHGVKDVQLLVLNRAGELAGIGELGEIHIRSPHLARGYLGDDQFTQERFITNPWTGSDCDRIYRTGELGRFLPDGAVEFVSRREDQVSVRGFRIDLGEIEAVLSRHSAVRQAVVVARPDETNESRLVAYVVSQPQPPPTPGELRGFLKQRLPDYMVPSAFVYLDAIPLTTTGKPDRRALPAPEHAATGVRAAFVPPRTTMQVHIAEVWKEVLGVDRVGLHDNFFDLGGHSLLSVQAVALLKKKTGLKIHPKSFVAQTLGQLASAYEEQMTLAAQAGPASLTRRFWSSLKRALFKRDDAR